MKARIDVKNRQEAENLQRGLARPDVRAFVITMGALETLPSDRARERVWTFFYDYFKEFPVTDPCNAPGAESRIRQQP
jgi:hypothetical protein